jgi:hypothetical protein
MDHRLQQFFEATPDAIPNCAIYSQLHPVTRTALFRDSYLRLEKIHSAPEIKSNGELAGEYNINELFRMMRSELAKPKFMDTLGMLYEELNYECMTTLGKTATALAHQFHRLVDVQAINEVRQAPANLVGDTKLMRRIFPASFNQEGPEEGPGRVGRT